MNAHHDKGPAGPFFMVDQWKTLANSEEGQKVLKLADGKGGQKETRRRRVEGLQH